MKPPSILRIPATILIAIFALPFAPIAWVGLSGSKRDDYMASTPFRIGMWLVVVPTIPLLLIGLGDVLGLADDPNPIGLGLLFMAGALIGVPLMLIGIFRGSTSS